MAWIPAAIMGGASLLGGSMGASASRDAANTQAASSADAIAEQRRQFDLTQANNAPFLKTGTAANSRLAYLLGLQTQPNSVSPSASPALSAEQLRAQLLPQFTGASESVPALTGDGEGYYGFVTNPGVVDEAGLWDAIQQKLSEQQVPQQTSDIQPQQTQQSQDPAYGSLSQNFSQPAPELKKFGATDLSNDLVYQNGLQFGLDQGSKAINARALATGNYDSGATLKALTQYGNDYATTKTGDAYNRFNTEQNTAYGRYTDAYNRFNTDNSNTYNRLAGISGTGQTAVNTVANAGTSSTNSIADLMTGSGNANAAGIVGGANAWGGALSGVSGAANNYQSNQTLQALLSKYDRINPNTASTYNPSWAAG